ncbi:AAA family ATPase [Geitlerinema sp. PCC 7407]|uniref:AAA family ATPase n=1 Tax=Geitlerinema sp. PCC 7407 TaxID=1173025 RepID=UPI00029FC6A0|nr:ATP-binding protein [Geitlerinema sp. PCC 7407]AFY67924.1 hypothetical protein GEI7407_3457 [Geitlerinema sp. PCC 7407]
MNANTLSAEMICVLKSANPFSRSPVVTNQDVWGKGFPDLQSHNAHASDAVLKAIENSRNGQCAKTSIVFSAEPGVGKSHVISRIHHQIQKQGGTIFVYASFGKFSDLSRIKYQFQQILSESLMQTGSEEVSQWQELAVLLLKDICRVKYPKVKLPETYPKVFEMFSKTIPKNPSLLDNLVTAARQLGLQGLDPDIIRAILLTLSNDCSYAMKWLSGKDLAEKIADRLVLPNLDREEREQQTFDVVRQLIDFIGHYRELVICFDEIDGTGCDDSGYSKAQIVSQLVKDLFDNLTKGIILTVMMPATWKEQILALSTGSGIADRVSSHGDIIRLNYLNENSVVDLVKLWLQEFYAEKGINPPTPLFPFEESQLREIGQERPTVRKMLKWCQQNWHISPDIIVEPDPLIEKTKVEDIFTKLINDQKVDLLDDVDLLDEALRFSFSELVSKTIEGVKITDVEKVEPAKENNGYINFKIVGEEEGQKIVIGISIRQESSWQSVTAGLKRLINYEKFGLTRGCLLRSKEINSSWSAYAIVQKLRYELGGEWVSLQEQDLKPLVAACLIRNSAAEYEVLPEELKAFLEQNQTLEKNPLIKEIMSKPSGELPEGLSPDEMLISFPSSDDSDESDDSGLTFI